MSDSYALKNLCKNIEINSYEFTWYDTGNLVSLNKVRKYFKKSDDPIILEKENESIWFVENKVIKFSDDKNFIKNRVKRAEIIKEFVPLVTHTSENMYAYEKVNGQILSEIINVPKFIELLDYCYSFWKDVKLNPYELQNFKTDCLKFYKLATPI